MDGRAESSLPFMGSESNLPQLRSELSASLLGMSGVDVSAAFQDESITAAVAAAAGVPPNLDSIGNLSPHRTRSIRDHESQIAELKKENFSLKLRIYFLEDRMRASLESDGSDVGFQQHIDLQVEVAQLKSETSDKQVLLQRAANAIDTLTRSNEELQDGQKTAEDLRAELAGVQEALEQAKEESKYHHDQYQEASQELGSLQSIQGDHVSLRRRYDDLTQQSTADKAKLEGQLSSAEQENQRLQQSLSSAQASRQQLQDAHASSSGLAERIPRLQDDLQERNNRIKALDDELAGLKQHVENLEREKSDLQAADSKRSLELRLEVRTRDVRIADLEAEVAHQQELLKGVEANLKESQGTSVQRAVHHYEELMAQHAKDLADTRDRLQAAQKQLTQKDGRLAALESQLAERDGRLAISATEVDAKSDALQVATSSAQKNANLVKDLGGQLKERNAEIARLRQELDDIRDELSAAARSSEAHADQDTARLASKLRATSNELEKLRRQLDQESNAKLALQDSVQAVKDTLASKEQALQNIRRQMEHMTQLNRQRQGRLEQQYQDQLESLRHELAHRDEAAGRMTAALQEKENAIKELSDIAGRVGSAGSSDHRDLHIRQLTNQVLELRRKIEQLTLEGDNRAKSYEKQLQQLRQQNSKLQRDLKDARSSLQQTKDISKLIEDANESHGNLLDALNKSFADSEGDETRTDLLQTELTARESEILALTSQLHEKEKEVQALQAEYEQAQSSHSDFVKQFQEALRQKDATIQQLLKAGQEKDEQLLRLTEDSLSRSGRNADVKSQLDELRDANTKLEAMTRSRETQLQSYQVASQAKDGVIKSLQEQLQIQRNRPSMSPMRRSAESLEADLLTAEAQLKASQELADALRKQLSDSVQEKDRIQKQLGAITAEAMAIRQTASSSPSLDVHSRSGSGGGGGGGNDEAAALTSELNLRSGKLSEAEKLIGSLRSQLSESQRLSQGLQSRLETEQLAAGQLTQLTDKLRRAEADLARTRVANDDLRDEVGEHTARLQDLTRLQAQLKTSRAERDLLQQQLDSARKMAGDGSAPSLTQLQSMREQIAQLQDTNRQLREDVLHANDDVSVANAEKTAVEKSLQRASGELHSKQLAQRQLEQEVDRLRGQLRALQAEMASRKTSATSAEDDCAQYKHLLDVARNQLKDMESAVASARDEVAALRAKLATSQEQQRQLLRDKQAAEDARIAEHADSDSLQQQLEAVRDQLLSADDQNHTLQDQLQQAKHELADTAQAHRQERNVGVRGAELPRSTDRLSDVSDGTSQADSLPDLNRRFESETARLRSELDVMRAMVERLSTERATVEQQCRQLSDELARSRVQSVGVGTGSLPRSGVHLDSDCLRRLLQEADADTELRHEIQRLLRQSGFSALDINRFFPQPATLDSLAGLRVRYNEGVQANDELRSRLKTQLSACEAEREQLNGRIQQQNKLLDELRGQSLRQATTSASSTGHPLDLRAMSGLTAQDLQGLCRDLSQSLRASQALQTDLSHNMTSSGVPMMSFLQQEKDRLAGSVSSLQDRLAKLEEENRALRSTLTNPKTGAAPADLSELERELQESHAIAARLRDTLATHGAKPGGGGATAQSVGHSLSGGGGGGSGITVDPESLNTQLTALRQALQQHTHASQSLCEQMTQSQRPSLSSSPVHQSQSTAATASTRVAVGPAATATAPAASSATATALSRGFVHMEQQVHDGLESLAKLETAIASAAQHVDENTLQHLLQLARLLRAQLESAEALLSQLKNMAPMNVSTSAENQLLKVEISQLRHKLAAHEKVMRKALKYIQKSKQDATVSHDLYEQLQHTDTVLQQSRRNMEVFIGRHNT